MRAEYGQQDQRQTTSAPSVAMVHDGDGTATRWAAGTEAPEEDARPASPSDGWPVTAE